MLCISGFVDDVMLSYNVANKPESKTTRIFRRVRQVAAPGVRLPSPTALCSELQFCWRRYRPNNCIFKILSYHLPLFAVV